MKKYDYVLVGAGLYSGVIAYLAGQAGKNCLVLERRDHTGGNIYCEEIEAISWHLSIALNLDENKMRRITFNEITKSAVKASIKQARDIDMNLVDEQQARRCLDRMVGYEISPLLWKKIKRGLSAGRVQSVALRIIGDREDEINAFIPKEYWTLEADLKIPGEKKPLVAKFHGKGSEKMAVETKEQLDEILKGL